MHRLLTTLGAALLLAGAMPALAANHPVEHGANAAGHGVARAWHGAARHGQKFLGRHSHSRRSRRYHLRKASDHAAMARRHSHAASANWNAAKHGK